MPLSKGLTPAARSANIAEEIRSGKDPKQAAAIAYAVQARAKGVQHLADGGVVEGTPALLGEDDQTITYRTKDGRTVTSAKAALGDPMVQALRSLPKAEAAAPQPPPAPAPEPSAPPPPPTPSPLPAPQAAKVFGVHESAPGPLPLPTTGEPPQAHPAMSAMDPSKIQFAAPAPGAKVLGGAGDFGFSKAINEAQAGIRAKGEAEATAAQNEAGVLSDYGKTSTEQNAASDQDLRANQDAIDRAQQEVNSYQIDRRRLWKNSTTGQRVLAGISIALSGIGAALQHQSGNTALEIIEGAIDKDVQDQKDALAQKKGAVEALRQKGVDLERASQIRASRLYQEAQTKLMQMSADARTPEARANAQQLIGELGMKAAEFRQQAADREMMIGARAGMAGKLQPAQAEAVSQIDSTIEELAKYGDQLENAPAGLWAKINQWVPWATKASLAQNTSDRLNLDVAQAEHPGRPVSPEFINVASKVTPQPGNTRMTQREKLKQLIADLQTKKRNIIRDGLPGSAAGAAQEPTFTPEGP